MGTWHVNHPNANGSISSEQLREFSLLYVEDDKLLSRISNLFWIQVHMLQIVYGIDPFQVLSTVKNFERGEKASGIKKSAKFLHKPLKGLWHKHYFSSHFMAKNMFLELGQHGLEKIINEVCDPSKHQYLTDKLVNMLAHRLTIEQFEKRASRSHLTGEWVIFAKHKANNYYLSLATHRTDDQEIYDQIIENCFQDFPELLTWIEGS